MSQHLCLDFGTAYSKAAVCKPGRAPQPLKIGEVVGHDRGDEYWVPTALFIGQDSQLYFGEAAFDKAPPDRLPFDGLKEILTAGHSDSELDEALPEPNNPTGVVVTKRQALALYFGFFLQSALRASGDRIVKRSIAIPVFEPAKLAWVDTALANILQGAQILADRFGDELFRGISCAAAIDVLKQNHPRLTPRAERVTVAEPVAAMAAHLLDFRPSSTRGAKIMMVVDVGAGTTDMAMFAAAGKDGKVTVRHVLHSKRSVRWAGKAINSALVSFMTERAAIQGIEDVELFRANIERSRDVPKEQLFDHGRLQESDVPVTVQDFLQSAQMQRVVDGIKSTLDDVLCRVDRSFFGRGRKLAIRFSGGGAFLPFLDGLVQPERTLWGTTRAAIVWMGVPAREPEWARRRPYASLYQLLDGRFHRLAVALGGAFHGARAHSWLRLEQDIPWLGGRKGPTLEGSNDGGNDDPSSE